MFFANICLTTNQHYSLTRGQTFLIHTKHCCKLIIFAYYNVLKLLNIFFVKNNPSYKAKDLREVFVIITWNIRNTNHEPPLSDSLPSGWDFTLFFQWLLFLKNQVTWGDLSPENWNDGTVPYHHQYNGVVYLFPWKYLHSRLSSILGRDVKR